MSPEEREAAWARLPADLREQLECLPLKMPERRGLVAGPCPNSRPSVDGWVHACACSGACLRPGTEEELREVLARRARMLSRADLPRSVRELGGGGDLVAPDALQALGLDAFTPADFPAQGEALADTPWDAFTAAQVRRWLGGER